MLSRAFLPLVRSRPLHTPSSRAFSQCSALNRLPKARKPPNELKFREFRDPPRRSYAASKDQDSSQTASSYAQQPSESIRSHFPSDKKVSNQPETPPVIATPPPSASQEARKYEDPQPEKPDVQTHRNTESVAQEEAVEPPNEPLPDLRHGIPSDYDPDKKPLPDLTQGIPSTIDSEVSHSQRQESSRDPMNITEDAVDPQASDARDRGGDGLPRSSYVSSSDRRRSFLLRYFYLSLGLGTVLYGVYIGRNWSEEETEHQQDIPNGYTPSLMYARAMARWGSTVSYYTDPVTKKLLPDAHLMDPNMPPYTLVLGLEDVLVHSEWSREHGWRIAKRPGLDYFLKYLSPYYELVIFSTQPSFTVDQIHRKIDPFQLAYPLFREMTVYEDGGYVKDLSYLNRDLSKVIAVDSDPHHVMKQPQNAVVIPKWNGDPRDTTLIDLIPFLENIAALEYKDTREVVKSFEGTFIPVEFDRRQKLLREKWEAQQAEKKRSRKSAGFGLGSIFGGKPKTADGSPSLHDAEAEGKHYTDYIRERGQAMYQRLDQHLKKEGPKILAEREAAEKQMQEEAMKQMQGSMFGFLGSSAKKE